MATTFLRNAFRYSTCPVLCVYQALRHIIRDKLKRDAEEALSQGRYANGLAMKRVEVPCYEGYRPHERPIRLTLGEQTLEILEVEDRWYSPGEMYFRVRVEGGDRYVLRYMEAQDVWSLEAYRSGAK